MISCVTAVTLVLQHCRVEPDPGLELLVDLGADGDPGDDPDIALSV